MDEYSSKHKKQHKKDKNKKRKYSSSESEDEWVEKKLEQPLKVQSSKRDEWMSLETDFTFSSKKENKADKKGAEPKQYQLEKLGQSSRELNPYWRDGGDGLPPEKKSASTEYGRKENSSRNSPEKSSKKNKEMGSDKKSTYDKTKYSAKKEVYKSVDEQNSYINRKNSSYRQESTRVGHKSNFDYNEQETKREKSNFSNRSFQKPKFDDDQNLVSVSERGRQSEHNKSRDVESSTKKRWQKESRPDPTESDSEPENQDRRSVEELSSNEITLIEEPQKIVSLDELNKLSASMIKAEMMGNTKLAEELKLQLEQAKKKSFDEETDSEDEKDREILILTETDSKGFTRPLQNIREERLNTKRKIETHEGNKRVRYFADDDSQSLQDMFEKERFGSSREQNATFMKLMRKELSENNEDAFEETASSANTSRQDRKNWNDAIKDNVRKEKALDSCYWCLDSKYMNQDTIVAVRNKVQLCVPSSYSLTDGHCIILPCDHISCATRLDEDVWEDIMSLRKNLVKVFEAEGSDVIFFECASNLDKFPHMQLHCVPVPKEAGDVAPIYFKKAIMECEMEWSSNKKVVDLKGKNVRKAIPKGLPYFAVDFGMQPGYAHVIEDRRLFPNNFAQEVIGGMLDIDHSKWRKYHRDSEENIQKKATYLKNLIQKHL